MLILTIKPTFFSPIVSKMLQNPWLEDRLWFYLLGSHPWELR